MCLLTLDHLQDQDVVFIYNSNREQPLFDMKISDT